MTSITRLPVPPHGASDPLVEADPGAETEPGLDLGNVRHRIAGQPADVGGGKRRPEVTGVSRRAEEPATEGGQARRQAHPGQGHAQLAGHRFGDE